MIESGYSTREERRSILVEMAPLRERMAAYPEIIAGLEAQLAKLDDLKARILGRTEGEAARTVLELLEQRRDETVLRAHQNGIVSHVRYQPGEVIDAGKAFSRSSRASNLQGSSGS